ncbi:flagellar hook protein FlgE [Geothermobacter hydrogeniphilus]|uniref:Flagellar hook protein FlgE n=1 Tax=Geothermobacter hydrogeniphilus TaxID=1969733 RepID=A0A2K2HCX2_9BACT|nr:flagellar hook protein FlgE [Geothermobacter hydrogeniphilus]PNU21124.1 flagellar hook protein FlgE [Geothermobacter hydrogeniphilus]
MGIASSLFSGVSGLTTNGNAMSVIGNNIANSNTIGFKSSRSIFADLLSSTISGSGGQSQIGRGSGMSVVDNIFSQGTFENTELNSDLAIEGPGFFMVTDPSTGELRFTRAGAFRFDADGYLINPEGYNVQGYILDDQGNTVGDLTDIKANTRSFSPANQTAMVTLNTNLNANSPYVGPFDINNPATTSNYAASIRVFDSLGQTHLLTTYFTKLDPATNPLQWGWYATMDAGELGGTPGTLQQVGTGTLQFDTSGNLVTPTVGTTTAGALTWGNSAAQNQQINIDFQTTQYSSDSVVVAQEQDGFGTGTLVKLNIDNDGYIIGNFSNGQPRKLAQIALSKFSNPGGLSKAGNNLFEASDSSGPPIIGTVGSGVGKIFTNSLEQSNVDLAQEFVKMITTQRGFQANSKIITTTDEMLNDLINLKR